MSNVPLFIQVAGPLSLAIPAWVGAMSTGDGFGHRCMGRNSFA